MNRDREASILLNWLAYHPANIRINVEKGVWEVTHWRTGQTVTGESFVIALRAYRKATAGTRRRPANEEDR